MRFAVRTPAAWASPAPVGGPDWALVTVALAMRRSPACVPSICIGATGKASASSPPTSVWWWPPRFGSGGHDPAPGEVPPMTTPTASSSSRDGRTSAGPAHGCGCARQQSIPRPGRTCTPTAQGSPWSGPGVGDGPSRGAQRSTVSVSVSSMDCRPAGSREAAELMTLLSGYGYPKRKSDEAGAPAQ